MSVGAGTIIWLLLASLTLGGVAVVLDRINFPQKSFRARRIQPGEAMHRDRTGAHIVDERPEDDEPQAER